MTLMYYDLNQLPYIKTKKQYMQRLYDDRLYFLEKYYILYSLSITKKIQRYKDKKYILYHNPNEEFYLINTNIVNKQSLRDWVIIIPLIKKYTLEFHKSNFIDYEFINISLYVENRNMFMANINNTEDLNNFKCTASAFLDINFYQYFEFIKDKILSIFLLTSL